ncbi:MAG: hypothetical protein WD595_05310 [Waddliaceae bacterium]
MNKVFDYYRSLSWQTKIFFLTGIIYIGFTVLLTIFSFARLDFVRTGPKTEQTP